MSLRNDTNYLMDVLANNHTPTITKTYHNYLTLRGSQAGFVFILKEGTIKTSVFLQDGREFNLAYINEPSVISLLHNQALQYAEQPFSVRIETQQATFYQIRHHDFWHLVKHDDRLQDYVSHYYQLNLANYLSRLQHVTMSGKIGALASFLNSMGQRFGETLPENRGTLINFNLTNDDIAGFCGISAHTSVSRIMRQLHSEGIVDFQGTTNKDRRIIITDHDKLNDYIAF